jgi:hypothetical protein
MSATTAPATGLGAQLRAAVAAAPAAAGKTWGQLAGATFSRYAHGIWLFNLAVVGWEAWLIKAMSHVLPWVGTYLADAIDALPGGGNWVLAIGVYNCVPWAYLVPADDVPVCGAWTLTGIDGTSTDVYGPADIFATVGQTGNMGTATVRGTGVAHAIGMTAVNLGAATVAQIMVGGPAPASSAS